MLLEPIANLQVTVPDSYTGDVMGDLNKRRGRVLGMNPAGDGKTVVEADIPVACLSGYCTDLRSMTADAALTSMSLRDTSRRPATCRRRKWQRERKLLRRRTLTHNS